jgi:hypothetical protein
MIGEYVEDLDQLVEELDETQDIYDAALDKTALNRYGSLVVNQQLSERQTLIAEVYHYEISDLPRYEGFDDEDDSTSSTTFGLQWIAMDMMLDNDILRLGGRYTESDASSSIGLYLDEKLRFGDHLNIIARLQLSHRSLEDRDQDTYSVRPGLRLDWTVLPDVLLDIELGYEYLLQEFDAGDFEVHQAFVVFGVRSRF